jgi:hypothetical protein
MRTPWAAHARASAKAGLSASGPRDPVFATSATAGAGRQGESAGDPLAAQLVSGLAYGKGCAPG